MNNNRMKGTVDYFLESLSPEQRQQHEEGYRELLISEMIIAAMENDAVSVRKLAKIADVSPTTVQNLRSGISDAGVRSLFKVFKSLGYSIFAEKGDERLPLIVPEQAKKPRLTRQTTKRSKTKVQPTIGRREIRKIEEAPVASRLAKRK